MPDPRSIFPSDTWDGSTENNDRVDLNSQVNPDLYDFNRLRAEVIALEDYIRSLVIPGDLQNQFQIGSATPFDGGSYTQYNINAAAENRIFLINATTKPARVYLPDPTEHGGVPIAIVKVDSSVNTVTVYPYGVETIQGQATKIIAYQWSTMVVAAPQFTNWYII